MKHPLRSLRVLLPAGFIAVVLFGWWYWSRMTAPQQISFVDLRGRSEVQVVLSDQGFTPDNLRISKGTKVIFSTVRPHTFWPASNPHPTHSIYPVFDPGQPIDASSTWSFVFDRPGEWGFHDHIRSYFDGKILVE